MRRIVVRGSSENSRIINGLQASRQCLWTTPSSWEYRRGSWSLLLLINYRYKLEAHVLPPMRNAKILPQWRSTTLIHILSTKSSGRMLPAITTLLLEF